MNTRNFFIFHLFCVLALFSFLIEPSVAFADEGIRISPNKIEALVDPGESIEKSIKILNKSNGEKVLYLGLRDFQTKGVVGQVEVLKGESILKTWIDIPSEGIKFAPQEEKELRFLINIPENAGPGGHYGAILIGSSPQVNNDPIEGDQGATVAVSHQVSSLLLLHVSGDVVEKASVREFSTDKFFYSAPFEVNFLSRIENNGNVHIKPRGMVQISNMAGEKIATVIINETGGNILPDSIREFKGSWGKKFGFGKYSADLILTYGTPASKGGVGQKTLSSMTEFWIFPVKIVVPFLIGLIITIVLMFLLFRFQKNKVVKRALNQMGVSNTKRVSHRGDYSPVKHFLSIFSFFLIVILFISLVVYFILFS